MLSRTITDRWVLLMSLAVICAAVATLFSFHEPMWETNDDVGMAMTVHGFGIAEVASPQLIYSNVIWGAVTQGFPTLFNTFGYSLVMLLAVVVSGWMVAAGTCLSVRSVVIAAGVTALLFARPLMIPQFTLTAGMAMVSAIVLLRLYATSGRLWHLMAACALAYLAFLVRDQMFYLLLAIALPLLPYRALGSPTLKSRS